MAVRKEPLMSGGCRPLLQGSFNIAGAFASTGVICACGLLTFVAFANVYSCNLLLWQALACKQVDLEGLAGAIAGPYWMVRPRPLCQIIVHAVSCQ